MADFWPGFLALDLVRTGRTDGTDGTDGRAGRTDGTDGQAGRTGRTDGIQFYSSTGTEKYSVEFYWDRKYSVEFYWDRKGYTLTTFVFFRAYKETGYPLTSIDIAKLYLFVNVYTKLIVQSLFSQSVEGLDNL